MQIRLMLFIILSLLPFGLFHTKPPARNINAEEHLAPSKRKFLHLQFDDGRGNVIDSMNKEAAVFGRDSKALGKICWYDILTFIGAGIVGFFKNGNIVVATTQGHLYPSVRSNY